MADHGIARDQLRRVARGRPVNASTIKRSAARNTLPYLRNPHNRRRVIRHHNIRAQRMRRCIRHCQMRHGTPRR